MPTDVVDRRGAAALSAAGDGGVTKRFCVLVNSLLRPASHDDELGAEGLSVDVGADRGAGAAGGAAGPPAAAVALTTVLSREKPLPSGLLRRAAGARPLPMPPPPSPLADLRGSSDGTAAAAAAAATAG